jgi:methylated-DNA-[protein]-cysteine S-methyltransferase
MTRQPSQLPTAVHQLFVQLIPEPPAADLGRSRQRLLTWYQAEAPAIAWCEMATPIGPLFLAAGPAGLQRISFADSQADFLGEFEPSTRLVHDPDGLAPYLDQLRSYFGGQRRTFSLRLDMTSLTDFQRAVLRAAAEIPAGQVQSYAQIARRLRKPKAARAVGQALRSNPLPIVLPCHRVITSDGRLGGYAGGLKRKRALLTLEGALFA